MEKNLEVQNFDYSMVPAENRTLVMTKTVEINLQVKQTAKSIIAIGNELIQIKEKLGRGNWLPWVENCFEGSVATAKRFMQAAKKFSNRSHVSDLKISLLLA